MFRSARLRPQIRCLFSLSVGGVAAYMTLSPPAGCTGKASVRMTSYNLLSSHLAGANEFKYCNPADLAAPVRLQRIQEKLQGQVDEGAIIGMQEFSHTFGNGLLPFFYKHGYQVVTAHYGAKFSDYMGVALAWPKKSYEALEVKVVRLSDTVKWPQEPKRSRILSWLMWLPNLLLGLFRKEKFDPWDTAKSRYNQIAMARLKHLESGHTFWIATYHMPCLFGSAEKRQTMVMHTYMALKLLQEKANATHDPYALLGDFNFKPGDSSYRFITEGKLDKKNSDYPVLPSYGANVAQHWKFDDVKQMQSAYAVATGREPEFTNHSLMFRVDEPVDSKKPQFTETLDYIFFSSGWHVESVLPLMPKAKLAEIKSFPTATEPSDHVMIGAQLSLL